MELFSFPYRRVKLWFQRMFRGWDDADTWALDCTLAAFLAPRLRRFKELTNGYPNSLTEQEWDNILDELIWTFEFIGSDAYWESNPENYERMERGLDLFRKYFNELWW